MTAVQGKENYVITYNEYTQLTKFYDSPENRRDRVNEYFKADKTQELLLHCAKIGGLTTVGTTLGGAVIGGAAGGAPGMAIGGTVGFVGGVAISAIGSGIAVRSNYEEWLIANKGSALTNKFKQIYLDHPILKNYICPVTKEPFKDPWCPPCGHPHEKVEIERWIDTQKAIGKVPLCSVCKAPISKEGLSVDILTIGQMKKAFADLAKNEIKNPLYETKTKEMFQALADDLDFQATEVLKEISTDLTLKLNSGKITPQTFARKIQEATSLLVKV